MKKISYITLIVSIFILGTINVNASSGQLRKASVKTCNGVTYGQHSSDNHWHVAEERDGKYYATGNPIYSDPCSANTGNNDKPANNNNENNSNNNNTGNNNSDNNNTTNNNTGNNNTNNNTTNNNTQNNNNNTTPTKPKEEPKNSDNTLKEILVDGKKIEVSDKMEYSTTKAKIEIEVTTNDEKATYEIKDNNNLSIGENIVKIEVKAEDGKVKTYEVVINRQLILSSNTGIEITIDGEVVTFVNKKATVYVSSSATSITIDYKLSDEKAKVNMDKLDKLQTGDNELKVEVVAEDGTKAIYDITVHKYSKTEDTITTIIAFAMLGGIGYGIYFVIKKGKKFTNKLKNK